MNQKQLIAEIWRVFGSGPFDTTRVICRAMDLPKLAAAIDAAAPNCRRRSRRPGSFQSHILRRVLTDLAKKHFITDEYGWWHIEKGSAQC